MSKMIKNALAAALLTALFACSAVTAQAYEAVDLTRADCSLTIVMKHARGSVSGGTLSLYRVGDIAERNGDIGFKWKDDLDCNIGMENLESAETAAKVLECVKLKNLDGVTVNVDDNGQVEFNGLEVGLYLIEQKTAAAGYTAMSPFLVSLPQWEDGQYVYSVTAMAKAEARMTPNDTPPDNPPDTPPDNPPDKPSDNPPEKPSENSPKNPGPKLPQTGQLNWPVPLLVVSGNAFLAAGFIIRRRKNDA